MSSSLLVIKIGGSAITDKSEYRSLKPEALGRLVELLAPYVDCSSTPSRFHDVIIVHGAGSFAHHEAHQYKLSRKLSEDPLQYPTTRVSGHNEEQQQVGQKRKRFTDHLGEPSTSSPRFLGLTQGCSSLQELHHHVVRSLVSAHIPALSCPVGLFPHGPPDTHSSVAPAYVPLVMTMLKAGFVPVLHGCFVLTHAPITSSSDPFSRGRLPLVADVISGDDIMCHVVEAWIRSKQKDIAETDSGSQAHALVVRAVFVSDVAGVFSADPKSHADATLHHQYYLKEGCATESEKLQVVEIRHQKACQSNPILTHCGESAARKKGEPAPSESQGDRQTLIDRDVTGKMSGKVTAAIRLMSILHRSQRQHKSSSITLKGSVHICGGDSFLHQDGSVESMANFPFAPLFLMEDDARERVIALPCTHFFLPDF